MEINNEIGKWDSNHEIAEPSSSKQYAFVGLPLVLLSTTTMSVDFAEVVDLVELDPDQS